MLAFPYFCISIFAHVYRFKFLLCYVDALSNLSAFLRCYITTFLRFYDSVFKRFYIFAFQYSYISLFLDVQISIFSDFYVSTISMCLCCYIDTVPGLVYFCSSTFLRSVAAGSPLVINNQGHSCVRQMCIMCAAGCLDKALHR